jgi:hypothetical protein
MATENLSEAARRTREIARASCEIKGFIQPTSCELTGETRFIDALAKVIGDRSLGRDFWELRVSRTHKYARLEYVTGKWNTVAGTNFGAVPPAYGLRAEAAVGPNVIYALTKSLGLVEESEE